MKILIVADEELEARRLQPALVSHGHQVFVSDCPNYLRDVRELKPDVLITDIFVHKKSALKVVEDAKRVSNGLRVVSVDSSKVYHLSYYIGCALALGADAALMKPVAEERLLEAIAI